MTVSFPHRGFVVAVGLVAVLLSGGVALAVAEDPQHEHPDEIDDDDDLDAVERWLSDRMGEIHADCSEGISIGNFDACEDLDEEYESMLERFVSVERDTTDEDDQAAEQFNETRNQQAELAELLQEFNATYEEYRVARGVGDEDRARGLARELRRLADRIEELGGSIEVNFRELDGRTSADLNTSADQVNESTEEVIVLVTTVEQETFEETTVSFDADPVASFEAPATVNGTLKDEDGNPITNGTVEVTDGHERTTAQTDEEGQFTTTYRPTLTSVGTTNVTARYVPADGSEFLGSDDWTTVEVQSTTSSVTITNATEETRFDGSVRVSGNVTASGEAVAGVPVTVRIADTQLVTVQTDDTGAFQAETRLPPDIPSGEMTLQVEASEPDMAIAPSEATTGIDVEETPTELSLATTETDDGVRITGELSTGIDAAVGERPLVVAVGDEEHVVTTAEDGSYELQVSTPDERRAVVVRYEEPDSNLESSSAETTIEPETSVQESPGDTAEGVFAWIAAFVRGSPFVAAIAGLALLVNLFVWPALWLSRRSNADPEPTADGVDDAAEDATGGDADADRNLSLLEAARQRIDADPGEAVKTGYVAVRNGLDGSDDSKTHWEFYDTVGAELDSDREAALRSLTESFEYAAFAPEEIDGERASSALADAERCLAAGDGGTTD